MIRSLITAVTVLCALCTLPAYGQDEESDIFGSPRWEFSVGAREATGFTLEHFPVSNRSVPRHADDEYLGDGEFVTGPLPDARLELDGAQAFDLAIHYDVASSFSLGLIWSLHTCTAGKVDDPVHRVQMNQGGTTARGYGTALRFYQTAMGDAKQFGLSTRLQTDWLRIRPRIWLRLVGGGVYDVTGCRLATYNGWDRWNSDEHWKTIQFARLYEHRLYAGLHIGIPVNVNEKQDGTYHQRFTISLAYIFPFEDVRFDDDARDMTHSAHAPSRIQGGLALSI